MGKRWQAMDLKGRGLQGLNIHLKRVMKSRRRAYALWLLFPLGLHRFYLGEPRGGMAYPALGLAALLAGGLWWLPLGGMLALALYDLYWIDGRVTALNKRIRLEAFLKGPP